ncbi:MAG: hypothetical protein ACTHJR_11940 [Sphingomonas sp.]
MLSNLDGVIVILREALHRAV